MKNRSGGPGGLIRTIGGHIEDTAREAARDEAQEKIEDHEERLHPRRPRPPNTAPLTAIPFANVKLDDEQLAQAMEWMNPEQDAVEPAIELAQAAHRLRTSTLVLERHLAEYAPRWRKFKAQRRKAGLELSDW